MKLEIYTDGSLKAQWGSWAYVMVQHKRIVSEASGKVKDTTSDRMEFQAAIEALSALPPSFKATLYSDSRNLVDTMTLWKEDWKKMGWIKKYSRPIPNLDLIQKLDALNNKNPIIWKWVRSHAGLIFNERCDQLCILQRKS